MESYDLYVMNCFHLSNLQIPHFSCYQVGQTINTRVEVVVGLNNPWDYHHSNIYALLLGILSRVVTFL